jgi:hypothetical protein
MLRPSEDLTIIQNELNSSDPRCLGSSRNVATEARYCNPNYCCRKIEICCKPFETLHRGKYDANIDTPRSLATRSDSMFCKAVDSV